MCEGEEEIGGTWVAVVGVGGYGRLTWHQFVATKGVKPRAFGNKDWERLYLVLVSTKQTRSGSVGFQRM